MRLRHDRIRDLWRPALDLWLDAAGGNTGVQVLADWQFERLSCAPGARLVPRVIRADGPLDVQALRGSLELLVARHDALRATFAHDVGGVCLTIADAAPVSLPVIPLGSAASDLTRALEAEYAQRFDLLRGPLARFVLFRRSEREHMLLLALHAALADETSLDVLSAELRAVYDAKLAGRPAPLPAPRRTYAESLRRERRATSARDLARAMEFYRAELSSRPERAELPWDGRRPPLFSHRGAASALSVPAPVSVALGRVARAQGASLEHVLSAAFQAWSWAIGAGSDFCFAHTLADRQEPDDAQLVGNLARTLVLRARPDGELGFPELLRRARRGFEQATRHRQVPLSWLIDELDPSADLARPPLFRTAFAFRSAVATPSPLGPVRWSTPTPSVLPVATDLRLTLVQDGVHVFGWLEYCADLFERARAEELTQRYGRLLAAIARDPEARLRDLAA